MIEHPTIDAERPWPGLLPFTEDARMFFHGREAETDELFRLIEREPLTVLFGQSGLGKSSLLNAGVFPQSAPRRLSAGVPAAKFGAHGAGAHRAGVACAECRECAEP